MPYSIRFTEEAIHDYNLVQGDDDTQMKKKTGILKVVFHISKVIERFHNPISSIFDSTKLFIHLHRFVNKFCALSVSVVDFFLSYCCCMELNTRICTTLFYKCSTFQLVVENVFIYAIIITLKTHLNKTEEKKKSKCKISSSPLTF